MVVVVPICPYTRPYTRRPKWNFLRPNVIYLIIFFCIVPTHRPRDLRTTAVTSSSVPAEYKNNINLRWPSSNNNDRHNIITSMDRIIIFEIHPQTYPHHNSFGSSFKFLEYLSNLYIHKYIIYLQKTPFSNTIRFFYL